MNPSSLASSHSPGSYITFRAGTTNYALPVKDVRYIAARDALSIRTSPQPDHGSHQLFDYDGKPTVLYRFSTLINGRSQVDESAELVQLLGARQQDHIDWVNALEHSVKTGEEFTKATDPHQCAFGKWYDSYTPEDEELKDIMAAFDEPHKRIHALAEQLMALAHTAGKQAEAIQTLRHERSTTLQQLIKNFEKATLRLEGMVKPVVLVLNSGEKTFALELDSLSDIIQFNDDVWLEDQGSSSNESFFDGFFQASEGDFFLNIVPRELLKFAENKTTAQASPIIEA